MWKIGVYLYVEAKKNWVCPPALLLSFGHVKRLAMAYLFGHHLNWVFICLCLSITKLDFFFFGYSFTIGLDGCSSWKLRVSCYFSTCHEDSIEDIHWISQVNIWGRFIFHSDGCVFKRMNNYEHRYNSKGVIGHQLGILQPSFFLMCTPHIFVAGFWIMVWFILEQVQRHLACHPHFKLLQDVPCCYDGMVSETHRSPFVVFRISQFSSSVCCFPCLLQVWQFPSSVVFIIDLYVLSSNIVALKGETTRLLHSVL